MAYAWLFLAMRSVVVRSLRNDYLAVINVLAAVPMTLISGGRNSLIQLGVAALTYWALFRRQNNRCVEIRGHRARGIGFVQATAVADGTQGGRLDHVRIPVHLHWSADKKPRRVSHELHVAFVGGQIHAMGRHDIGFHPGLVPPDIRQNRA